VTAFRVLVWGSEWPWGLPPEVHVELAPPDTPPRLVASRAEGLGALAIAILPPMSVSDPATLRYLRTQTSLPLWLITGGTHPDWVDGALMPYRILVRLDARQLQQAIQDPQPAPVPRGPVLTLFAPGSPSTAQVAVALAVARQLEQSGRETVLCDFDLYTPRLALDLDLWPDAPPYPALETFLQDPSAQPLAVPHTRHVRLVPGLYHLEVLDDLTYEDVHNLLQRLAPAVRIVVTSSVVPDAATFAALTAAQPLILVVDDGVASRFHLRRYRNLLLALGLPFRDALLVLDHGSGQDVPLDPRAVEEEIGLAPTVVLPPRPLRSLWGRPGRPEAAYAQAILRLVDAALSERDAAHQTRPASQEGGNP